MRNEKPILFTGAMVNAILEGRKTQTRRIVKPQPASMDALWPDDSAHTSWREVVERQDEAVKQGWCKHGKPGDRLWVRETFLNNALDGYEPVYFYRADDPDKPADKKWKPSIFMPRIASRITLKIESVRVERLQEISDDDAIAEGMESYESNENMRYPHEQFMVLWNKINGKTRDWKSNPWLWVISFSVTQQKGTK